MKNVRLFSLTFLAIVMCLSFGAKAAIRIYTPNTADSMTASSTYCQNATATAISFVYSTCVSGNGAKTGTAITVKWYSNTSNTTTGGTLLSTTSGTSSTAATGTLTYTPSTTVGGTLYYYCVIEWDGSATCNTSGSLTSATSKVVVNGIPVAITGSAATCAGSSTTLGNTAYGGSWTSSNSAVASVGSSTGVVAGIASGAAVVTYATGCGTATTKTVTVSPALSSITGATSVCAGLTTTLRNTTSGGTWNSSNTSVAAISASGIVTGITAGTTIITYTSAVGCTTTTAVTVNSLPASITGSAAVCAGSTIALTDAVAGGTWSTSDATTATVSGGTVTGVAAGSATISYTAATGCYIVKAIAVNALPASITGTTTVCSGKTVALADATAGGTWSSANASIATVGSTGIVAGVAGGSATISYTDGNGCANTAVVTVNASPAAIGFTTYNVCTGSTITLTNTTPGGTWSSSSTTKATVDANTGVVSGILAAAPTITYKLTSSGCFATKQITVSTTPQPITGTKTVCVGSATNLADASTGATWSSSNSSIASVVTGSGAVTGITPGTATISYINNSTGCAAITTVTVNPGPAAITGAPSMICTGASVTLSDATPGGIWTNSNTRIVVGSTTGVVTGMTTGGTVDVVYQLPTGCKAIVTMAVSAAASPITGSSSVCEGGSIALYDGDAAGTWSVSDSSLATVTAGTVTGLAAGTPVISYTRPNGCTAVKAITVNAAPATITGSATVCLGTSVTLSNAVSGGVWTSGNTSVATVGSASGVVTGVVNVPATISYTLANGCVTTTTITVNPMPYSITGTMGVCPGASTALGDAYTSAAGSWSSSNSSIATVDTAGNVTGVTSGTATISYTLATGCAAVATVTVNPTPASITGSAMVCLGSAITMSNVTSGGHWENSNTRASVDSLTGVVTGLTEGPVVIRYVLNATGCMSTTTVSVNPLPSVIYGVTTVGEGATVTLASGSEGGNWNSSNSDVATCSGSGDLTGVAAGYATVTYTLPATGCFVTTNVTVVTTGGRQSIIANDTASTSTSVSAETSVYPNPATTSTINVKSNAAGVVYIFSIDGKEVSHYNVAEGVNTVNMPSEAVPGIYMCIFKGNNGITNTTRLVYKP